MLLHSVAAHGNQIEPTRSCILDAFPSQTLRSLKRTKSSVIPVLGSLVLCALSAAMREGRASPVDTAQAVASNDQRIADRLESKTEIKDESGSLEDVLLGLAKQHEIAIRIENWSFFEAGVDLSPNVTSEAVVTTLRNGIKSLIESVSGGAKVDLALEAKDGVLSVRAARVEGDRQSLPQSAAEDPVIMVCGTVHSSDGSLAGGCDVVVRRGMQTIVLCADKNGRFAVPMRRSQCYQSAILMRSADGRQLATYSFTEVIAGDKGVDPLELTLQDSKSITVHVTDDAGNPIEHARVAITGNEGPSDYGRFEGSTDASGTFTARVPSKLLIGFIYASKRGAGIDYRCYTKSLRSTDLLAKAPDQPTGREHLTLTAAPQLKLRFVDDESKPIAGLSVSPWYFEKPGETSDLNLSGDFGYLARTDVEGEVTFDWLPKWNDKPIPFWVNSKQFERKRLSFDPRNAAKSLPVVKLQRLVEMNGTVSDAAGNQVANAVLEVSGKDYSLDELRKEVTTARNGRFRIDVPPHHLYMLAAYSKDRLQASVVKDGIAVYPGKPVGDINLKLRPATRVFGQLTLGPDRNPIAKHLVQVYIYGRDLNNLNEVSFPHDGENHWWIQPLIVHSTQSDADGRFEFRLGPGKYDIRGTEQNKATKFEIADEKEIEFNFHSERPETGTLRGKVVTRESGTPVQRAKISGVTQGGFGGEINAVTKVEGTFEVMRKLHPAVLFAYTEGRSLAGIVEIGADDNTVTIPIAATTSYSARIVDKEKKPLSTDRKIEFGIVVHDDRKDKNSPFRWCFGGLIQPDQEGRVAFKGLIVGALYEVMLHNLDGNSFQRITTIVPKQPGDYDLGELGPAPPSPPYRAPSQEERITQAFERPLSATQRNRDAKDYARLADAHVLITFADPLAPLTKKLFKLYFDGEVSEVTNNDYRTVAISTSVSKRPDAEVLAKELGIELPKDDAPLIVVEATDGKVLGILTGADLVTKDKEISEDALRAFVKQRAPPHLDGQMLFDEAKARAKRENKRLLIQETAVWCGPCHRLAIFLDKNRQLWEKDYLWVRMDIRWSQASEIMKALRREAQGGYPWVAVLDADGKVLATSNNADGANIGFPSELDEIAHFVKMFRSTAQRMTDNDFLQLKKSLENAP